jgi:hypothetical protein
MAEITPAGRGTAGPPVRDAPSQEANAGPPNTTVEVRRRQPRGKSESTHTVRSAWLTWSGCMKLQDNVQAAAGEAHRASTDQPKATRPAWKRITSAGHAILRITHFNKKSKVSLDAELEGLAQNVPSMRIRRRAGRDSAKPPQSRTRRRVSEMGSVRRLDSAFSMSTNSVNGPLSPVDEKWPWYSLPDSITDRLESARLPARTPGR